jgi:acetyl esterase/lipase
MNAPIVKSDGVVTMPSFDLPLSRGISAEAKELMTRFMHTGVPPFFPAAGQSWATAREKLDTALWHPTLALARSTWPVSITNALVGGIPVWEISSATETPVADKPLAGDIIIHVHCGAFVQGRGFLADVLPLACMTGARVISVDFRMPPEFKLRAAVSDVLEVYGAVCAETTPSQRVVFLGTSSGGDLATMVVSTLIQSSRPLPGALVLLGAAGGFFPGDSTYFAPLATGAALRLPDNGEFVSTVYGDDDPSDATFAPLYHPEIMAKFPPSFLLSSTRGAEFSSVIVAHRTLRRLGVSAELHMWEGLPHGFHCFANLPEAREAYATILAFLVGLARQ